VREVPMADGGDGTLDVLVEAYRGRRRSVVVSGPLGEPVEAPIGLIREASAAVIEMASVAGYGQVPPELRNPLKTTSYGVGELIRAIVETEIEEIILTVGGSATVDGGIGMMQALGVTFRDRAGRVMPPRLTGGDLPRIGEFSWDHPPANIENVQFTIACDVLNPACGPNGAAAVFGPQKGADADGVRLLDAGLAHWADLLEGMCPRSVRDDPGTGAAGGVALPLLALAGASIVPGIDLVCEATGLPGLIASADLVLTGEGRLDRQSMMGKVVGSVGRLARTAHVPCIAVVGTTGPGADDCLEVLDRFVTLDAPLDQTERRLAEVAEEVVRKLT
jgi:glycerate 2-kinase